MAFTEITDYRAAAQSYICLSTDSKLTTGVKAGARAYETDSQASYVYDGSAWHMLPGIIVARKTLAFTGAANLGAVGAVPLFTVTGEVEIIRLVPVCTEDLVSAGGGTLILGVTGSTSLFLALTTATAIDNGEFWFGPTPSANGVAIPAALQSIAITDNILATVATGDVTDGTIVFTCYWRPISANGLVVPA